MHRCPRTRKQTILQLISKRPVARSQAPWQEKHKRVRRVREASGPDNPGSVRARVLRVFGGLDRGVFRVAFGSARRLRYDPRWLAAIRIGMGHRSEAEVALAHRCWGSGVGCSSARLLPEHFVDPRDRSEDRGVAHGVFAGDIPDRFVLDGDLVVQFPSLR